MKSLVLKTISIPARAIRGGLAMVLPVLFIGSMTVLLNGFPVPAFQDFLDSFLGGAFRSILLILQVTTIGILAVYLTIAINLSYMNLMEESRGAVYRFGSLMCCLTGFFILVGFFTGERDISLLSGQGVFSALLSGLIGTVLFRKFVLLLDTRKKTFVDGADASFNSALHVILPVFLVILCFAAVNYLITAIFQVQSVQHLFMKAVDSLFSTMQRSFSSGLLFTVLISAMWWFGIHGNNVLNQVAEDLFTEIIPGQIVSKSFIDTFVIMGGTGCLIGLLLAMMLFGKRRSTRRLSRLSFLPGIFNISELLVFGFPVIYNPLMLLPFILSPALCYTTAYLLTVVGFLPEVGNTVVWTTPPLLSGYLATGSGRGILVQVINILISTACYAPFVILHEKKALEDYGTDLVELTELLKTSEEAGKEVVLTECEGNLGRVARSLATDLEESLSASSGGREDASQESPILLQYRPRSDEEGQCTGVEALLEWEHKRCGRIYPPLVIRLAAERGSLFALETYVIEKGIRDLKDLREQYGERTPLIIHVTADTLCDKRFPGFLRDMAEHYMLRSAAIRFELSERELRLRREEIEERISILRSLGYAFLSAHIEGAPEAGATGY